MLKRLGIVALALIVAGCAAEAKGSQPFSVNGHAVSVSLYRSLVTAERQKIERTGVRLSQQSAVARAREARIEASVIRDLIRAAVIEQLARSRGITITTSELQRRLTAAEQTFGGPLAFEQALQQAGISKADFALMLRYRLLEAELTTSGAGSATAIDDAVRTARVVVTIGPCAGGRGYPSCLSIGA